MWVKDIAVSPRQAYYAEDSATTFNWALTDTEEGGHYGVGFSGYEWMQAEENLMVSSDNGYPMDPALYVDFLLSYPYINWLSNDGHEKRLVAAVRKLNKRPEIVAEYARRGIKPVEGPIPFPPELTPSNDN